MITGLQNKPKPLQGSPRAAALIAAALMIFGLIFIGQGFFTKGKAAVAQYLLDVAWERSLASLDNQKPWKWADTWPVAKLSFPSQNLSQIVLRDAGGEALAFGPAMLASGGNPGQPGTTIIAAHRDTHFVGVDNLSLSDTITIQNINGTIFTYRITRKRIARWNKSGLYARGEQEILALVTCWPIDATTPTDDRLILEAIRVPDEVATM